MSLIELIDLPNFVDSRGSLVAIEGEYDVPFAVRRVYFLYGTEEGAARGYHAHKNLKQVLICVSGHCRIVLDSGSRKEEVLLDRPTIGLLVKDMVWREMHDFSADCVLVVLASEHFNEQDYIRDYSKFKELAHEK